MRETARKKDTKEAVPRRSLMLALGEVVREDLREFVAQAGIAALAMLLESERTQLCGPRYVHRADRRTRRSGHAPGELMMGGRRVRVRRPRVRSIDGHEVALPSWDLFSSEDPLYERAVEQMLVGVSTRRYARSLEPVPATLSARGTSKSAVSRRFVAATEAQMGQWLSRDLSGLDLAALMIDGVHVGQHVLLVALGIDADGKKHVLGVREGATENATSCTGLLTDLRERGLRTERTMLVVLDGSKALAKAVREVYGTRALIQRCQAHKTRNVLDQLPDDLRPSVRQTLREAYAARDTARAKKLLMNLARRLRDAHPSAAASLEEGLDETLTVMRLAVPRKLERALSTTNAIENLIGSMRLLGNRVKRWRSGRMIVRWVVTAVADAASRFRRVMGAAEGMAKLLRALAAYDVVQNVVESRASAA